jgi:hypothetical protein
MRRKIGQGGRESRWLAQGVAREKRTIWTWQLGVGGAVIWGVSTASFTIMWLDRFCIYTLLFKILKCPETALDVVSISLNDAVIGHTFLTHGRTGPFLSRPRLRPTHGMSPTSSFSCWRRLKADASPSTIDQSCDIRVKYYSVVSSFSSSAGTGLDTSSAALGAVLSISSATSVLKPLSVLRRKLGNSSEGGALSS